MSKEIVYTGIIMHIVLNIYVSNQIFAGKNNKILNEYNFENLKKKINVKHEILNISGKIKNDIINTNAYFFDNNSDTCMLFFNGNTKNIRSDIDTEIYFLKKYKYDILCYNYLGYYNSTPACKNLNYLYEQGKQMADYLLKNSRYTTIILYALSLGGLVLPVVSHYISTKYTNIRQKIIIINSYYNFNNIYPCGTQLLVKTFTPWDFKYSYKCFKYLINNDKISKYFFNSIYEWYNIKNTIAYFILNKNDNKNDIEILNTANDFYQKNRKKITYDHIQKYDYYNNLNKKIYKIKDNYYIYLLNGLHNVCLGDECKGILNKIYDDFFSNKL